MKRSIMTGMAVIAMAAGAISSYGTTNYWDNNSDTAGFGTAGGTWGVDGNWSSDSTGASVPAITNTTTADLVNFGTATNGLAGGTITVDSTTQSFNTMTFGAASEAITISGGELELAYPASTVEINNGTNTIGSVLAGTNGLHKAGTLWHGSFLTSSSSVIFPNLTLADFAGVDGFMGGGSIPGRNSADVFSFINNGTNATCQLQFYDGTYTKCVGLELTQVGADIAAKVRYAKYVNGLQLGYNFDAGGNISGIATSYTAGGYGCAELLLLPTAGVYEGFLTSSAVVAFPNADLSKFVDATGNMAGSSISGNNVPGTAYYFENNGTTATFQLQVYNGGYTKCIKVELAQAGPDITARAVYVKYYNSVNNNVLGFNFDTGGNGNTLVTSYTAGGYGLPQLQLVPVNDNSVLKLTGVNTYTGDTVLGKGRVEINGWGSLANGSYAGDICNSGELNYDSATYQTLSGSISGGGSLVKGNVATNVPATNTGYVQTSATVVLANANLSDYFSADGRMGGANIAGEPTASVYFFENDGATASGQFQVLDDVYTKCVKVEFTQVGSDIAARAVYARYTGNNQLGFDFESGANTFGIATSAGGGGYGVSEITLNTTSHSMLTLSAANSYLGGTTVNSGILKATTTANALPSSGGIVVNSGTELILQAGDLSFASTGGVGNGNPITLNGGHLTLNNNFNAGYSRLVTSNGGVIENNRDTYMNNIILQNGATFAGNRAIRAGYHSNPRIEVSGASPSYLNMGLTLFNNGKTLTLDVADVTGDDATDLAVTGPVNDSGYAGLAILKDGAGTATFSANNNFSGPVTINEGTIELAVDSALDSNNITINGGTLDMGTVANTAGTLTVGASGGTIALGTGALSFADSSAIAWSGTLSLTNTLVEQSVRFGTDDGGLTTEQQRSIDYNGGVSVRLDAEGYLTAKPLGTIILMQ